MVVLTSRAAKRIKSDNIHEIAGRIWLLGSAIVEVNEGPGSPSASQGRQSETGPGSMV